MNRIDGEAALEVAIAALSRELGLPAPEPRARRRVTQQQKEQFWLEFAREIAGVEDPTDAEIIEGLQRMGWD